MTREAGGPASARLPSRGSAPLIAIAALWMAIGPCLTAGASGPGKPNAETSAADAVEGDPQLKAAIQTIEKAFKERNPQAIVPLVSPDGKVFLSFHTVGKETGYYGRDQVYFILQRVFRQHQTTGFTITVQTSRRQKTQALCTSQWVYRTNEGQGNVQIFFVLMTKSGQWSLVQIREAA